MLEVLVPAVVMVVFTLIYFVIGVKFLRKNRKVDPYKKPKNMKRQKI